MSGMRRAWLWPVRSQLAAAVHGDGDGGEGSCFGTQDAWAEAYQLPAVGGCQVRFFAGDAAFGAD